MSVADLAALAAFGAFLDGAVRKLGPGGGSSGPGGGFSLVEHVWHLADLEREAFAVRIERLLSERDPHLPDFDGAGVARERDYGSRDAAEGLRAFREARERNLSRLRSVATDEWSRSGHLEGFGRVLLRELPKLMRDHDASHRAEIAALLKAREET